MTSTSLKGNAARLAGQVGTSPPPADVPTAPSSVSPSPAGDAPVPIEEPPVDLDPETVPVHVAWSRVMREVTHVSKARQANVQTDTGKSFKMDYRGVDDALIHYGPACRRHGVLVLPVNVAPNYRDVRTAGGKPSRECTVVVTYNIVGPAGDTLTVQAAGESLDSGDKGSAKAQAVALRTLLFHGGLTPAGDPDPDSTHVERAEASAPSPAMIAAEVLEQEPSRIRMNAIKGEVERFRLAHALVTNEHGQEEKLLDLVMRKGFERFAPKPAAPAEPPTSGDGWGIARDDLMAAGRAAGLDDATTCQRFSAWEGAGGLVVDDAGTPLLREFAAILRAGAQ